MHTSELFPLHTQSASNDPRPVICSVYGFEYTGDKTWGNVFVQAAFVGTTICRRSWENCSRPDFLSSFLEWGLISWSALPCLGHEPIFTAAWKPISLPATQDSVRERTNGEVERTEVVRQTVIVMEGLTWVETVGREAESETASVKPITWNKSNGFSSLGKRLDVW